MSEKNVIVEDAYKVNTFFGSAGCQLKYFKNNIWYKVNTTGYEGLAEKITGVILKNSNYSNYVEYEICKINDRLGCYSVNFCNSDEQFISMERLYFEDTGRNLTDHIYSIQDIDERYKELVTIGNSYVIGFEEYFDFTINLDYLTCNVDRHLRNLGFIQTLNGYRTAPIFDNGASFFSNYNIFPVWCDFSECKELAVAKTFSGSFSAQLNASKIRLKIDKEKIAIELMQLPDSRCKTMALNLLNERGKLFSMGE